MLLNVRWVVPGLERSPTLLAFTGFGHRLDPWQRLKAPGWRVGVVEFPIGSAPTEVWKADQLAAQLDRFWGHASHRALFAFSYGGAGATAVARVLAKAEKLSKPDLAVYIAPVQWARAPWTMLKALPVSMRLKALRGIAKGSTTLLPLAGKLAGNSVRQFAHVVERYVGWNFVAHYLPYIDWIDSPQKTIREWNSHPWPSLLVGAGNDTVIPVAGLRSMKPLLGKVEYWESDATHFNAVDAARQLVSERLQTIVASSAQLTS